MTDYRIPCYRHVAELLGELSQITYSLSDHQYRKAEFDARILMTIAERLHRDLDALKIADAGGKK